jgi:hypothetical protein
MIAAILFAAAAYRWSQQRPRRRTCARKPSCCARTHVDPDTADRIKELVRADIDWVALVETALRHKTMSLL